MKFWSLSTVTFRRMFLANDACAPVSTSKPAGLDVKSCPAGNEVFRPALDPQNGTSSSSGGAPSGSGAGPGPGGGADGAVGRDARGASGAAPGSVRPESRN